MEELLTELDDFDLGDELVLEPAKYEVWAIPKNNLGKKFENIGIYLNSFESPEEACKYACGVNYTNIRQACQKLCNKDTLVSGTTAYDIEVETEIEFEDGNTESAGVIFRIEVLKEE